MLTLVDGTNSLMIRHTGFNGTVASNPGDVLGSTMANLEPGEHRRSMCLEAAQVPAPIHLESGGTLKGLQTLIG